MRCLTQAWQVLSPWQRETVHSRLTVQQMADEFNCLIPGMEHLMSPQMALRHEFATRCANAAVFVLAGVVGVASALRGPARVGHDKI